MVDKDFLRNLLEDESSVDFKVTALIQYIEHTYLRTAVDRLADEAMQESMYATVQSDRWETSKGAAKWMKSRISNL